MKNILARIALLAVFAFANTAFAQAAVPKAATTADSVAVVIQISLNPGVNPETAMAAMNDMRAFVKKQPGYLSSEFMQNLNAANTPSYVNVVRWTSMKYWESVFNNPEFTKLNANNTKNFSFNASAFKTVK
jgi:heme-degrading monooxygenase HmoA